MFLTSVAHDYWKGFVTMFIEMNDEPFTIFGNPPVKKAVRLVNIFSMLETFTYLLFSLLFIVFFAVNNGKANCNTGVNDPDVECATMELLWLPFAAFLVFFGALLIGMILLYVWFTWSMFKYARSFGWMCLFIVIIPIGAVNLLLCFGAPFLTSLLIPIQHATDVWQGPGAVDATVPLFLGLFGALLRGFVRPREDEQNPYSYQKSSKIGSVLYYLFLVLLGITIILVTSTIDNQVPIINSEVDIPWILAILPLIIGEVLGGVFFLYRAIYEGRLAFKKGNPNGDSRFKCAAYSCLTLFIVLILITEILFAIILEEGLSDSSINPAAAVVPTFLALIALFAVNLCPFIFKKKVSEESGEKEMLTIV